MPRKPKRPCSYPGCPNLTEERYCEEHKKLANRQYDRYSRDKAARKLYASSEWKRIRARFLAAHPLCEQCRKEGRLTKATEVHHILPLRRGGTHDESNLMALCKPCHSRISVRGPYPGMGRSIKHPPGGRKISVGHINCTGRGVAYTKTRIQTG